ncbi:MAG: HDOD domain-containing protein [Gammaproteobacteria bacterium]|nr:HDOD domain-containing protein [Gammaproteobacteria bacterium]
MEKLKKSTGMSASHSRPDEMVAGIINLISLPEICIRINTALENPSHTNAQLGEIIAHDPAMAARILRIVNSAYYQFPSKVEMVSRAISLIGEDDLRALVLATSAREVFERIPNQLVNMELFWQHSVFTGIVARLLSKQCNILHGERLFIAGLLHDIGKLILYYKEPELSQKVLRQAADDSGIVHHAEQQLLGFTHADVGAALTQAWQLPESFHSIILHHHQPDKAQNYQIETAIVHLANTIVNTLSPDIPVDQHMLDAATDLNPASLSITGIDLMQLPALITEAQKQTHEVLNIMFPMY